MSSTAEDTLTFGEQPAEEPAPRPIDALTAAQRKTLAIHLLNRNRDAGNRELTAGVLCAQTGLHPDTAYRIKREWRGGQPAYRRRPRQLPTGRRARAPKEVSWAILQDFLDAHPGQDFTRRELSTLTGVPESTITELWRAKLGVTYHERGTPAAQAIAQASDPRRVTPGGQPPQMAEILAAGAVEIGDSFTICGFWGGGILADHNGQLYRLVITALS